MTAIVLRIGVVTGLGLVALSNTPRGMVFAGVLAVVCAILSLGRDQS